MTSNDVCRTKPTETSRYIRSFTENYDRNVMTNRNSLHKISPFAQQNNLSPTHNIGSNACDIPQNLCSTSGQTVFQSDQQIFGPISKKSSRPVPGLFPIAVVSRTAPAKQENVSPLVRAVNKEVDDDGSTLKNGSRFIINFIDDLIFQINSNYFINSNACSTQIARQIYSIIRSKCPHKSYNTHCSSCIHITKFA